jgi:hypothetical protein
MYWDTDSLARRISEITTLGFLLYGLVLPPVFDFLSLHLRPKFYKC